MQCSVMSLAAVSVVILGCAGGSSGGPEPVDVRRVEVANTCTAWNRASVDTKNRFVRGHVFGLKLSRGQAGTLRREVDKTCDFAVTLPRPVDTPTSVINTVLDARQRSSAPDDGAGP